MSAKWEGLIRLGVGAACIGAAGGWRAAAFAIGWYLVVAQLVGLVLRTVANIRRMS